MLNLLIADDNIEYVKKISNSILYNNEQIRLVKIASNVNETIQYVKECKIDLILLNFIMPYNNGIKILEEIKELDDYNNKPKVIVASADMELTFKIKNEYDVLEVIDKNYETDKTINIINKSVKYLEQTKEKYDKIVYKELQKLKYNVKHKGTKYIFEAILYIINNNEYENVLINLEKKVYPAIACKFNKTTENIKNNIVKATNNMYNECSIEYLMKYFDYECDKKPTPKMVITTIINKLLLEKNI